MSTEEEVDGITHHQNMLNSKGINSVRSGKSAKVLWMRTQRLEAASSSSGRPQEGSAPAALAETDHDAGSDHQAQQGQEDSLYLAMMMKMDRLSPLPEDVLCRITSFLDVRSLLQVRRINRSYAVLASRNEAGWRNLCVTLWQTKIHVPPAAQQAVEGGHHHDTTATLSPQQPDRHPPPPTMTTTVATTTTSSGPRLRTPSHRRFLQEMNDHEEEEDEQDDQRPSHNSPLRQHDENGAYDNNTRPSFASSSLLPPILPNNCMQAYRLAWLDAQQRQHVTLAEFCFDIDTEQGTVWSFRFKQSAGTDWTSVDPWYNGLPCRKMVFLKDGTVKQYVSLRHPLHNNTSHKRPHAAAVAASAAGDPPAPPRDSPVAAAVASAAAGGSTSSVQLNPLEDFGSFDLLTSSSREETRRSLSATAVPVASGTAVLVDPPLAMTWRFLTRPMDLPTRPLGSYVRFSVGGRDVPTYAIRRSPTGNWGFIMESCWGLYASFDLPPRRIPRRRIIRRTEHGARWVDEMDLVDDGPPAPRHHYDPAEAVPELVRLHRPPPRRSAGPDGSAGHYDERSADLSHMLGDDSSLIITNEIQWREAFLYNVGARVLPEGDEATDEFDRAWGGL